jgi:hypothetical protein
MNGGATWSTLFSLQYPQRFRFGQGPCVSPNFEQDRTIYVLTATDLLRSTDRGDTWEYWADERLAEFSYSHTPVTMLTGLTTSPLLNNESYQIFVGTGSGEFWVLDPDEMDWQ